MKNVLLIHGWNPDNYYNQINDIAWHNRMNLINELSENYKLYYPDLPGFGLNKPSSKEYNLDDYAKWINDYIKNNDLKIDMIIGYSFGGAVSIRYKELFDKNIKLILISPAIIRNNSKSKKFVKTPKIFNNIRNIIRNYYLIHILKTNEMVKGDIFLRRTYQNIVRVNLLDELNKINSNDIKIIYGKDDDMVNPYQVIEYVNNDIKNKIYMIEGDHDIGNTNIKEIIKIIKES